MRRFQLLALVCVWVPAVASWPDVFTTQTMADLSENAYDYYGSFKQATGVAKEHASADLANAVIRVGMFSFSAQNLFDNVDSFTIFKPSDPTRDAVLAAPKASITRIPASDVEGAWFNSCCPQGELCEASEAAALRRCTPRCCWHGRGFLLRRRSSFRVIKLAPELASRDTAEARFFCLP